MPEAELEPNNLQQTDGISNLMRSRAEGYLTLMRIKKPEDFIRPHSGFSYHFSFYFFVTHFYSNYESAASMP